MDNDPKKRNEEPQPSLRLEPQDKPPQKININQMPLTLFEELEERAGLLGGKKVPQYCRIVLEHAIEHQSEYAGPYKKALLRPKVFSKPLHIPLKGRDFMQKLVDWDPYGQRMKTDIAISILRKHIEVRRW